MKYEILYIEGYEVHHLETDYHSLKHKLGPRSEDITEVSSSGLTFIVISYHSQFSSSWVTTCHYGLMVESQSQTSGTTDLDCFALCLWLGKTLVDNYCWLW